MESIKYLAFYALLLLVTLLGFLSLPWLVIVPAALILTVAFITVKGKTWRQVMGKNDLSTGLVLMATVLSQLVLGAFLFGLGRLVKQLFIFLIG